VTKEEIGNGWTHPGWKLVTLLTTASLILTALQIDAAPRWMSAAGVRLFGRGPTHITYTVYYVNTGKTQQTGVSFKVTLPGDTEYVKGTTYFRNVSADSDWKPMDDGIAGNGVDFSGFAPNDSIEIALTAELKGDGRHTCDSDGLSVSVTTKARKATAIASSTEVHVQCE
jgi:uncharacterized repeat protein (TIGR01451 family)